MAYHSVEPEWIWSLVAQLGRRSSLGVKFESTGLNGLSVINRWTVQSWILQIYLGIRQKGI